MKNKILATLTLCLSGLSVNSYGVLWCDDERFNPNDPGIWVNATTSTSMMLPNAIIVTPKHVGVEKCMAAPSWECDTKKSAPKRKTLVYNGTVTINGAGEAVISDGATTDTQANHTYTELVDDSSGCGA